MTTAKYLGIWMDHSRANLMEFNPGSIETKRLYSEFTHEAREEAIGKSEKLMHNKENHQQAEYYKHLGEKIRHYESVLLFGPTHAKDELFNILKADHHFESIKIEVIHADKMTDNQQHAFVKDHFSRKLHLQK